MRRKNEEGKPGLRFVQLATWSRFLRNLCRQCAKLCPTASQAEIEDSVAEAVVEWWVRHRTLENPRMEGWVLMRAKWRLLDALRRANWTAPLGQEKAAVEGPDAVVERMEVLERASRVIIRRTMRAVTELWLLGWTSAEIARHLKVSGSVVRKRLERMLTAMRNAALEDGSRERCHTSACSLVFKMGNAENERYDPRKEGRKEGSTNRTRQR